MRKLSPPKLTIVILSYNVEKLLLDCLASIPQHKDWRIIVVDNASSDNSVAKVKKDFPNVELIQNHQNIGFAAGNNIALKKITSPYTLLLNPDTIVYPNTIETVLKYIMSHPEIGAATCRVELPDGSLDYSCHRGFPNPINSLLHFIGLKKYSSYTQVQIPDTIHEIDSLTGAFALFRTKAAKPLGWFDEDYFWNGEDIDLCYRLKKNGWKIVYLPQIKITHYKGSSSGIYKTGIGNVSAATKSMAIKSGTQVMKLFYKKHLSSSYPQLFNYLVYLGIWILEKYRLIKRYL